MDVKPLGSDHAATSKMESTFASGWAAVAIESEGDVLALSSAAFPFDDARQVDVHDPSISKIDGGYLMTATSPNEFVPSWFSKDLVEWKSLGPILSDAPKWLHEAVPQHRSVWAPASLVVGSTLRVYYCASQKFGSNTSFLGVAENRAFDPKQPQAGWADLGLIVESHAERDNFNAIDPDALIGPDGRHWLVYGSYWSGMYLLEIDPETGLQRDGAHPLHVASNPSEPNNPLEAPCLRYRDGTYYLFVTYGLAAQGVRSTYRMMVGRSDRPEGPFLGFDGKPMTEGGHTDILKSSPPMFGPGGGNVFQDAQGEWWFAYHYYDSTRHWHQDVWGRPVMQIRRLVWGPDGWPLPGLPAGMDLLDTHRSAISGEWIYQANFGEVETLEIRPDGVAALPKKTGSWTREGNRLTLSWPATKESDGLELDRTHQYFVGRNQAGSVVRGIRTDAQVRKL